MCFSAQADLAAGVFVTAVGVDALRRVRTPKELPLAALPLSLGIHQLIEAFVWWGLAGSVSRIAGDSAIWLYLAVAFVLPLWVPLAVREVEPSPSRKRLLALPVGVGALVTVILLEALVRGPVSAHVEGMHVSYLVDLPGGLVVGALYLATTCGALLLSSDRWIRAFGMMNLAAVGLLVWLTVGNLTSLWCVWAADHERGDRPVPARDGASARPRVRLSSPRRSRPPQSGALRRGPDHGAGAVDRRSRITTIATRSSRARRHAVPHPWLDVSLLVRG